jgi:hypothetical protein
VWADGRIVSLWLSGPKNATGYHEIVAAPTAGVFHGADRRDVLDGSLGCGDESPIRAIHR